MEKTCSRLSHTPGCLQFEVFRSAAQPTRYALIEHWASWAAHEAFQVARGVRPEPPAGVTLVREYYNYQTWEPYSSSVEGVGRNEAVPPRSDLQKRLRGFGELFSAPGECT